LRIKEQETCLTLQEHDDDDDDDDDDVDDLKFYMTALNSTTCTYKIAMAVGDSM